MHPGKIATIAVLGCESFLDLFQHLLFIHLGSAVLSKTCNCRLCSIPVALPIQGEMRGLIRQAAQRIAEDGDILRWLHTAQLNLALCETSVWVAQIGGRAQI